MAAKSTEQLFIEQMHAAKVKRQAEQARRVEDAVASASAAASVAAATEAAPTAPTAFVAPVTEDTSSTASNASNASTVIETPLKIEVATEVTMPTSSATRLTPFIPAALRDAEVLKEPIPSYGRARPATLQDSIHAARAVTEALTPIKYPLASSFAAGADNKGEVRGVSLFTRDPATDEGPVPSALPAIKAAPPVVVSPSAVNSIFTEGSREANLIGDLDKISHLREWLGRVHKRTLDPEVADLRADLDAWPARREKLTHMVEKVRRESNDPAWSAYKDQIDAFLNV